MTPEQMAEQTSETRARIGREVEARLEAAGAQCTRSAHFGLWYVEQFLSVDDRLFLIDRIERGLQPSILLSDDPEQDFRTSQSSNFDRWDEDVRAIDRRICDLVGLDERQGETLQGQRYSPGQYFRAHHDFFHTDQAYWPEQEKTGGQRTWTAMIFLNRPDSGGETAFTAAGLTVPPRPGMLLAWNNMDERGAPNLCAAHEGKAVQGGLKYIVTKWFREGFWV